MTTALEKYKQYTEDEAPETPLERLRFFLSLGLNGQDWLDVEPFLTALSEQLAQYEQDARRYRKLVELLQQAYDGNAVELENSFIVDCSMVSGYKTERRVQAVIGWGDTRDEPLNLDAAIDQAMEQTK